MHLIRRLLDDFIEGDIVEKTVFLFVLIMACLALTAVLIVLLIICILFLSP